MEHLLCSQRAAYFFHSEFVFLHVSHSFEVKHFSSQRGHQCQRQQERRNVIVRVSVLCLYCLVWVFFFVCLNVLAVLPVLISSTLVLSVWLPGSAHLHLVWVISWVHIETRVAPPVFSLEISQLLVGVFQKIQSFGRLTCKSSAPWWS